MDDIVKTARMSGLDAALAINRSMDEIRSQIDQMVDHERFLLVGWETRADALEQRKTWLIAAAVLIVTVLAGAALALARLEARRRRKATEENVHLQSDLEEREKKIRRLVDANIIGIIIWDLEGRILEANDAFLRMVGYDREDLASGRLHWTSLTPAEWRDRDARTMAELELIGTVQPFEKEYSRKDGSRVPVLIGGTMFEEDRNQGVSFVLDLTERKRAEAEARESERRYREMQTELAHANRVATTGQLTASIAHEVNQPIAAAVTNAQAALRWLGARPPDLDEVRQALARIVRDAHRAGDVIGRIRDLIKKAPPRTNSVDMNEAVREVIELDPWRSGEERRLTADGTRERFAAHQRRSRAIAAGRPKPHYQRRASRGRGRGRGARGAHHYRSGRAERRASRCQGFRGRAWPRQVSSASSRPSTRPSPAAWAWGYRSAVRSSKLMRGECG